jgi:hypothetical protein
MALFLISNFILIVLTGVLGIAAAAGNTRAAYTSNCIC